MDSIFFNISFYKFCSNSNLSCQEIEENVSYKVFAYCIFAIFYAKYCNAVKKSLEFFYRLINYFQIKFLFANIYFEELDSFHYIHSIGSIEQHWENPLFSL